jgi:8-oxo-dGTP pyrophosphatase MutT (NUDIX family)
MSSLQSKYAEYARLVIGVVIIHPFTNKLLILQRASTETMLPNMYELPGGGAESSDGTVFDTVVRETREETGLVVSSVVVEFEGFEYPTRKGGKAIQFNFLVEVESNSSGEVVEVVLNPEEHQGHAWIDKEDDLDSFEMTEDMRNVVQRALALL